MKKVVLALFFVFVSTYLFGQTTVTPPSNLTAVQVTSSNYSVSVKLTWSKSTTANVRYSIYRKQAALNDTTKRYTMVSSSIRDTFYADYGVAAGSTYSYYAVAYTGTTTVSAPSNKVEIAVTAPVIPRGWIYGRVTDDSSGAGLANAYVNIITSSSSGPTSGGASVRTDSNGKFAVRVYGGNYYVYYSKSGYVSEYYNNASSMTTATKLTIANNDSTAANAGLAKYVPPVLYTVKGKVTDTLNRPVQATVYAYKLRSNTYCMTGYSGRTDANGNYTLNVRSGDTVVVYASPSRRDMYFPEYYNDKKTYETADRIGVAGNITGINLALAMKPTLPNGIAGVVKDTLNAGVASHLIAYQLVNGRFGRSYVVMSDSLGAYSFSNMAVGKYILKAIPVSAYKATYFKYNGSNTLNWRQADSIMVDSVSVRNGINVVVRPRSDSGHARIAGSLRNTRDAVVPGTMIYAMNAQNEITGFAITNNNGYFEMTNLEPGSYSVTTDAMATVQAPARTVSVDYEGAFSQSVSLVLPDSPTGIEEGTTVSGYSLAQNYPNPFNPSTAIRFTLPESGIVSLTVYNALGQQVAQLVNEFRAAGTHTVTFDASKLTSGVYVYKLNAGSVSLSRKLMLMK